MSPKLFWKRIFVDTVSTNKKYAVDTSKNFVVDTVSSNRNAAKQTRQHAVKFFKPINFFGSQYFYGQLENLSVSLLSQAKKFEL